MIDVYSERTILLGLLVKMHLFCSSHLRIDINEEVGFQTVLCMHQSGVPKVFTWHIKNEDLKYLPKLELAECTREYFDTKEKYDVMRMLLE